MKPKKLVGALLLGVLVLWIIGWASSRSHKPDAPQVVQASPADKWQQDAKSGPRMDDSQTVVLTLDSENVVQGPLVEQPNHPLIVRCQQKKTAVYVVTGMASSIEEDVEGGPSDFHKVGLRLDDDPARYFSWGESTGSLQLYLRAHLKFGESSGIA